MDEAQIVEAMGREIRKGDLCDDPELPFPCTACDGSFEGGDGCMRIARSAWDAAKAALAEAGMVIVPYFPAEAMLRVGSIAAEATYDNDMGKAWNVYRAMIVSAPDQR